MSKTVNIEVSRITPKSERMVVELDNCVRAVVILDVVGHGYNPVAPALIALGLDTVQTVDEAGRVSVYTAENLLRGRPDFYAGRLPETLGTIRLTRRWSEQMDQQRLDVSVNNVSRRSVEATHMNLDTLRAILPHLGFSVGHIVDLPLAA
jgi:hypothetical protein